MNSWNGWIGYSSDPHRSYEDLIGIWLYPMNNPELKEWLIFSWGRCYNSSSSTTRQLNRLLILGDTTLLTVRNSGIRVFQPPQTSSSPQASVDGSCLHSTPWILSKILRRKCIFRPESVRKFSIFRTFCEVRVTWPIWRFPEMGVPRHHQFIDGILPNKNHPAFRVAPLMETSVPIHISHHRVHKWIIISHFLFILYIYISPINPIFSPLRSIGSLTAAWLKSHRPQSSPLGGCSRHVWSRGGTWEERDNQ